MSYTKSELLQAVAEKSGVTKAEAERVIDCFFTTVVEQTKTGTKVSWPGFGSFTTTARAARVGRNPQTGAEMQIPASTAMKFTAAKNLKDQLNN